MAVATYDVGIPWFWDMIGYLMSQLSYLDSKGVSGYTFVLPNTSNPLDGGATHVSAFSANVIVLETQDATDMSSIWTPILAHINATWPQAVQISNTIAYGSFLEYYEDHNDQGQAGQDTYIGSHLMDAASLQDPAAVGEAWKTFSEVGGNGEAYLVAGAGVRDAKPRGGGDAACPAWRKAIVHASKSMSSELVSQFTESCMLTKYPSILANSIKFLPLNVTAREDALVKLNAGVQPLRDLAPHMGAYMNEVGVVILLL
jgi:hypothetical protein